jgi:hypothetical protein
MTAGTLTLAEQTLAVFVDDTGHERLVEGHPVYGLGGCAAMAHDLERIIRHPWHEVRRKVRGSPDLPLHAAALGHPPRREDIGVRSWLGGPSSCRTFRLRLVNANGVLITFLRPTSPASWGSNPSRPHPSLDEAALGRESAQKRSLGSRSRTLAQFTCAIHLVPSPKRNCQSQLGPPMCSMRVETNHPTRAAATAAAATVAVLFKVES